MRILLILHGESRGNADGRAQGLNDEPLTALGHSQADALAVVAHGGTCCVYLSGLLGLDYRQRQPWVLDNASLSSVLLDGLRPHIALLNDTCHLNSMRRDEKA